MTSRRPHLRDQPAPSSAATGAGAAGPDAVAHWRDEAARLAHEAETWRAIALQWQKLCAAATLEAARADAGRCEAEGLALLRAHGWPENAP